MNPKVTKLLDIAYANGALKTGKFIYHLGKKAITILTVDC